MGLIAICLAIGVVLFTTVYGKNLSPKYGDFACANANNHFIPGTSKLKLDFTSMCTRGPGPTIFFLICITLLTCVLTYVYALCKKVPIARNSAKFQQDLEKMLIRPKLFSFEHLSEITNSFHESYKVDLGSYHNGIVYKGMLKDGTEVALKRLQIKNQTEKSLREFFNEVILVSGLRHKNLIQLKGCAITEREHILVYEYAANGDLRNALWGSLCERGIILSWDQRMSISIGIANGLAYLHTCTGPYVIHQDINTANILLDHTFTVKISSNFGLAKTFSQKNLQEFYTDDIQGTRGYGAPEYVMYGETLSSKGEGDVYGFGIVLLEIISGRHCLHAPESVGDRSLKTWVEMLRSKGTLLELLDPKLRGTCPTSEVLEVIDIATFCLNENPKKRPNMVEIFVRLQNMRLNKR